MNELWLKAKKKFSLKNTEKEEFFLACKQYKRQHGHHPKLEKMKKTKVPGLAKKVKFLINIGQAEAIMYTPGKSSRKGGHNYLHQTKNQVLLTDSAGIILIYHGETKMKNDGWLHD